MTQLKETAAVLGGGSFGTAVASILAENGHQVRLWVRDPETAAAINKDRENSRYLPGTVLPDGVEASEDLIHCLSGATLVFMAIPSKAFIDVLRQARDHVAAGTMVVSCTKGIAADGFLLMSQLLAREWPHTQVGVLSGPNLAREIVEKKFAGTVIASTHPELCTRVQHALSCPYFRVYDSSDPYGVELGGALKNIYAIATGMADALDVGDNTRAFLITRSLAEISRFSARMGANPMTFLGLAGVGDLIVTCSSNLSRNYQVGYLVGQGNTVEQAVASLGQTAEGVNTVKLVAERARSEGIYMPLATGLYDILFHQRPIIDVVTALMQGDHNHDVDFMTGLS
ncbi:NAD(P)H-dependent glycerol-3-phosphate dehydrogenase [Isoalcanivorax beigongshangi]|uniref:Glycerol-3-phosphate dehydrogenase [NAD(P)+] n=1 Tax=Isoalcanivorax beigongshangi TaxID=3238810 RepID=A0ABV4AHG2_9GAMM